MFEPGSANCKAKKGLLVLRDCGKTATAACSSCGIPVCSKHQVVVSQGVTCPDCASRDTTVPSKGHVGRSRRRSRYYDNYRYDPYYYGHGHYHSHYYSDHDHHSVSDRNESISDAETVDDTAVAEVDSFDDFDDLES